MDYVAGLLAQNRLLVDLLGEADLSMPVPTCPGWNLAQLVRHVGGTDRWAAVMIRTRATVVLDPRTIEGGRPPADRGDALAWLQESPRLLLEAVAVDPDVPVWTFTGPRPARWWVRRRMHEAMIHRVDAAFALGVEYPLEAVFAADGISEWLGLLTAQPGAGILPDGATVHLHATDEGLGLEGEWAIRGAADGIGWEHAHEKGDVAVRGAAADLLLALMRRIPGDDSRLQVLGEQEHWTRWLANTSF
ncbi:maleylpyruvate isomerase family mycothiol-dependent enzyme [Parafrankia sp. FMc2]|uniref:maleylpyruvate isomerase family mycothiol-dependent enzyme n=1 Tax=Parafrankia sp. FMc2 TaxID=3233196 RepID=UPI0034D4FBC8